MIDRLLSLPLLASAAVLCVALAAPARADLIVTGGNAVGSNGEVDITPGGTATVYFSVYSTNTVGDDLNNFNMELLITPVPGHATSFLQFASSQTDPYGNSSYVFFGHSFFQESTSPFWGPPISTVTANDTITGGDFYDDPTGGTLIQSSNLLLGAVQIQADPHASIGDTFTIDLVQDPSQTYFVEPNSSSIAFTDPPATIKVVSGAEGVVPAPPSLALAMIGGLSYLAYAWRIRRRRETGPGLSL